MTSVEGWLKWLKIAKFLKKNPLKLWPSSQERLKLEEMKREFMEEKEQFSEQEEKKSKSKKHHKKHKSPEKPEKSKFDQDFENMWKQRFGESYRRTWKEIDCIYISPNERFSYIFRETQHGLILNSKLINYHHSTRNGCELKNKELEKHVGAP